MQIDPEAARRLADSAERCASGIEDTRTHGLIIVTAKWLQGEAYLRINDMGHAAPLIAQAKMLVASLAPGDALQGEILLSSGGIHQDSGEVAMSLSDYQHAHDVFAKNSDVRGEALALVTIASLYNDANDPSSSLKYLKQAQEVYYADHNILVSIYNNIGRNLQDLRRFKEAEAQYRKALMLADRMGSALLRARILGNIARVRLKAGDVEGADRVIRQGYALTADGEAAVWRPQFVGLAAQAAVQRKDYARAARLVAERFDGVDPTTTTLTFREAHQTAYETYRALGDTAQALVHLAALKRLDDKATALATSSNTALMAARFDFANQALKIARLQARDLRRSIAFQQAQAQTERTMFRGAAGGGAVVIGLLVFALITSRRARRKVDAANADLAVTNESLGRALAAKTEFLATTSHEIRTPLNGILGMAQVMLADRTLSADLRDRIGLVHDAGTAMRALVDDILDVAKMERGKLTLERTAFDLAATVGEASRMWEEQARDKGIGFAADLAEAPGMIEGDPGRVRQIVFNLLSNAVKFTARGEVRIAVTEAEGHYAIAVSDSGIGIAADMHEQIFESFRQADAGTTRQFGGTGLGLAICRNLARAMGGDIAVASTVGEGATFTVTLPLVHAEAAGPPCGLADKHREPVLLIVDRNPIARSMLRTLLAPRVGTVIFAGDAEEAAECVVAGGIAHVLLDDATIRAATDPIAAVTAIAVAAARGGSTVTLLWPAADAAGCADMIRTGVTRVVAKPVGGSALAAAMFGTESGPEDTEALVSRAA